MKEKLKNFFKDKKLWSSFVELLATILIVFISFFSGFSYGVTIDDDIRDEFIADCFPVSNTEQSSLNIEIDKKEIIDSNIPTNVYLGTISSTLGRIDHINNVDIDYLISFAVDININVSINNDNIIFSDVSYTFSVFLNEINFLVNTRLARYTYIYPLTYNDFEFSLPKNFNGQNYYLPLPYFIINEELGATMVSFVIDNNFNVVNNQFFYNSTYDFYSLTSWYNNIGVQILTDYDQYFGTQSETFYEDYILLFSNLSYSNDVYTYVSNFYLTMYNNYLSSWIVSAFGGVSAEELEQAYQQGFNIGYQSGEIEGVTQFKLSQEFQDILNNEYQDGINKGKEIRDEEYEQTDTVFTKIWTFLRDTISTTLSIFNIQIMPGIPLYFIVVIPIVIGLILWLFKLLQR